MKDRNLRPNEIIWNLNKIENRLHNEALLPIEQKRARRSRTLEFSFMQKIATKPRIIFK